MAIPLILGAAGLADKARKLYGAYKKTKAIKGARKAKKGLRQIQAKRAEKTSFSRAADPGPGFKSGAREQAKKPSMLRKAAKYTGVSAGLYAPFSDTASGLYSGVGKAVDDIGEGNYGMRAKEDGIEAGKYKQGEVRTPGIVSSLAHISDTAIRGAAEGYKSGDEEDVAPIGTGTPGTPGTGLREADRLGEFKRTDLGGGRTRATFAPSANAPQGGTIEASKEMIDRIGTGPGLTTVPGFVMSPQMKADIAARKLSDEETQFARRNQVNTKPTYGEREALKKAQDNVGRGLRGSKAERAIQLAGQQAEVRSVRAAFEARVASDTEQATARTGARADQLGGSGTRAGTKAGGLTPAQQMAERKFGYKVATNIQNMDEKDMVRAQKEIDRTHKDDPEEALFQKVLMEAARTGDFSMTSRLGSQVRRQLKQRASDEADADRWFWGLFEDPTSQGEREALDFTGWGENDSGELVTPEGLTVDFEDFDDDSTLFYVRQKIMSDNKLKAGEQQGQGLR